MGDDITSASFLRSNVGYDKAFSLRAWMSPDFADISKCRIARPGYQHVIYHGSTPRALPTPHTISPSLFDPLYIGFASFENQDWGYCSGWIAMKRGDTDAFPAQEPPPVESPFQGMAEYPAFQVPVGLKRSDAPGGGQCHNHEGSSIDIREAPGPHGTTTIGPLQASSEMFRFQATLMAPTTIRKMTGEPLVTYLNKGQTYSVSITDTASATQGPIPTLYRTSIRITFDYNSAENWQLWKNSRGTTPGQGQGSTPQAVEYIGASDGSSAGVKPRLDSTSLDGFSVIWSRQPGGSAACTIDMRFYFLSTDFRLAQGVQGLSSRLCAKTEIVSVQLPLGSVSEICYCEVRLFGQNGAEQTGPRSQVEFRK